ncbi:polymeric immunoglobulin receptor isoform X2 [Pteropus medius]|uniref:polymeric immunoglobulin receptor isoform X2 n=1 Tax=Pteropus vampyrus TaxID=132908 RepID=UPI00196A9525|nr:polymeric immunoglobulin receptor isoform X2 [Pteropus giganteus]
MGCHLGRDGDGCSGNSLHSQLPASQSGVRRTRAAACGTERVVASKQEIGVSDTAPREPSAVMLFFLTCLLAVFPVVSMKSPIFGPQEVNRLESASASIKCYYPATSVNRHSRKYWCQQGARGRCTTLISSEGYVSKNYEGKANLTNFPESNMFVVDIGHLTQNDSGRYRCGLGMNNQDLFFDVRLKVSPALGLLNGTKVYTAELGRTVTISCPFNSENSQEKKSVCRKTDETCVLVIDSSGYVSPSYCDRVRLSIQGTSQLVFNFVIDQLQLSDAGMYVCQAGDNSRADKSNVDLQVLKPEPKLVYGDLRGSVTFDCALSPKVANLTKFVCRVNNGKGCEVVINTLGKRAQAFEGRILLTLKDKSSFRVHITGLKREDAGHYLCGAHSDGEPQEGWPTQAWQLFVNEETTIPRSPSVVKSVVGGSVALLCPYNPKDRNGLKYWCRWNGAQNGGCPQLVSSEGLVKEHYKDYEGRLALYEEPGNGTYTVILNQLTTQDAGFYWCLTDGDTHWWSTVELKVVEGEPNLEVPTNVTVGVGETLNLPCHLPCKFASYEKFWCKWSSKGCKALPSHNEGSGQASVNCSQGNQLISLILNSVTQEDEGWYWCGVKENLRFRETVAVYVEVKEKVKDVSQVNAAPGEEVIEPRSQDVSQVDAAPGGKVIEPRVRKIENKVVQDPKLFVEDSEIDTGDSAHGRKAPADPGSSVGQGGSSTVLVSTLVPLALVLALGALAVGVVRARHRRNVDRVSIRSYRTDISMSDFENSRDFGANDNMGASSITQETALGGKDEFMDTSENTVETEQPKKAKRSSKEEADMAYTAFLLQANNMTANVQDGPSEA